VFSGEVLFQGKNLAGQLGLWETNGTPVGTLPVTNKALSPSDLTVFHGQVLFNGTGASGHAQLWRTDGTDAGTIEVAPISGAAMTGLNPADLTVFNNEVLFNGVDSRSPPIEPASGLWVTDGTVAGTKELVPGGSALNPAGLAPSDLTVFGADVLFAGAN